MMLDSSDPYSVYLGLSPGERPPHHYELLGVELFCSQFERINQAVRKQFRIVKRFHDHHDRETREAIQDIMTAIANAKVVLTDPERKEEYDVALAERLGVNRDALLAARIAAPVPEFEVVVIAGPSLIDHRCELVEGTPFTIGADNLCSLPLEAGRAAERHCAIEWTDGEWLIRPSDNECFVQVNGNPIEEFVLVPGDKIEVGGYRLEFRRIERSKKKSAPAASKGDPSLTLIVQKGPSIPMAIFKALPPQRVVIGQGESALWQLPDATVSRVHCAIQTVGDRWEIEDLDSTNGTKLNGIDVVRDLLNDRDVVTLGGFDVLVSLRY